MKVESIQLDSDYFEIDQDKIERCIDIWNNSKRKMILVGVLNPNSIEENFLQEIDQDESLIVFTETTSNLHHPNFLPGIDKIIAPLDEEGYRDLQPDLLLTLGGLIVSKKIKAFLRKYKPKHHWHVGPNYANDTFFCLSEVFRLKPNQFFSSFLPRVDTNLESNYKSYWDLIPGNPKIFCALAWGQEPTVSPFDIRQKNV